MKVYFLLVGILCLLPFFNQPVLSQNPILPNISAKDTTENIKPDDTKPFPKNILQSGTIIENLIEPSVTSINFDDIIIYDDNSVTISPNRYAGVSFYSPYYNNYTYLTRYFRYSHPNSLIVGYDVYNPGGYYEIYSNDTLVIEFAQPSKDVAFLWGQTGYYNSGQIQVYNDSNQLVTTAPVNFNGYSWTLISTNQYSQRIKKLVLRRPPVSNNLQGHIHIDNFQFTPITTSSPIGYFDSINSDGVATGWTRDPDTPNEAISVHYYLDGPAGQGTPIGQSLANLPHPDPNQTGHGFSYSIPAQYRDGLNHSLYAYGIDKTGDPNTLMAGSPKTFNLQKITITNPRVSGDLSNTTQYALLGGDITLSANFNNGNYEWFFTGSYVIVNGSLNSPTITIRSTNSTPITAAVRNAVNSNVVTPAVNINIVSPSLNSYSAEQKLQLFTIKSFCYGNQRIKANYMWSLGCLYGLIPLPGILFSASIQIPSHNYLTDSNKSGVKYVQAISNFRKRVDPDGRWFCNTARNSEDNANTGWHLDSSDPYGTAPEQLKYFSQGNLLEITNNDSPAQGISSSDVDAVKIDDRFEMYVVYFSGDSPSAPNFQKRLGSLSWRWGGIRSFKHPFNQSGGGAPYQVQEYYGVQGPINKDDVVSMRTYNPMPVEQIPFTECRGITSLVDGSSFFVGQQYRDFLNRQPSDDERETGRFPIASCAFNADCISSQQAIISREFFRHTDFVAAHPELNPSGEGTHDFNVNFVRWCYFVYLRSTCEPDVCDSRSFNKLVTRLDTTGDYVGVVKKLFENS